MAFLNRLEIYRVRNIAEARLTGLRRFNVVAGANGSGKTSVLEAVYLLGMGRSFRSGSVRPVVSRGEQDCIVSGVVALEDGGNDCRLGIQRDVAGGVVARSNGVGLDAVARLAEALPLQLIDPDSFGLLSGGPKGRRRFVDWGVFHVEHDYLQHWRRMQKALRQRNSILRHGRMSGRGDLAPWTRELTSAAVAVDQARRRYLEAFLPVFEELLVALFPGHGVTVGFYSGWESGADFAAILDRGLDKDRSEGYTHFGPQRADLRMRVDRRSAAEVLSRGQQKMLVCAMKLAQGLLLARATGRHCVYLVDDLAAELDMEHRRVVVEALHGIGAQVIFTAIEDGAIQPVLDPFGGDVAMFHVEHGRVSERV